MSTNSITARRSSIEAIKPFQLVRLLSLSSLMVILVCTLALSAFISQRARDILFKKSEQYALIVAENLNHQVFFQFTLPALIADGEIKLSRTEQYERLDRVVRNAIHGFAVERVNIYDPGQVLTYSTEPGQVGNKGELGAPFERALDEESVSLLVGVDKTFLGFAWGGGRVELKTYLPMWEERPMSWKRGKILGVYEITQDVTNDYESILRFQWLIMAGFLAFVGVLFTAIMLIGKRADVIIATRAAERIKLEEQLHQAERLAALGEMVAGVSHEIRNPLGIIRSTAELLDSRLEQERHRKLASIIVEEATRLNDILTEFLDFARPKTLKAAGCRVEDILEHNLRVIEAEMQRVGVAVEREYAAGPYSLEADANLLYRAFVNIFANALQAMPEGGRLKVRTALINGRQGTSVLEVRIQDTGQGIPADVLKKVFNPFFTTREKGTGLGLAIVQSIVDSHHGDVEIQSEENRGTTMVLRLPLTQPDSAGPLN